MKTGFDPEDSLRGFAVICVLGPPGAGKGTLCTLLARTQNLVHYSVGDSLREYMRGNHGTPLAALIQDRLDNQGFLPPDLLNPFISNAIKEAIYQDNRNPKYRGILIDGFPRCTEQLESFDAWPFQDILPPSPVDADQTASVSMPDIVLLLQVTRENAQRRYVARARDNNDQREKFERRYAEYTKETAAVEDIYRRRGILISIEANGTKEENVKTVTQELNASKLWHEVVVGRQTESNFVI